MMGIGREVTARRAPLRARPLILGVLLLATVIPGQLAAAARLLAFRATGSEVGGVAVGEVWANNTPVLRFRSRTASDLAARAELVAGRLRELALKGLRPEELATAKTAGAWGLMGAGQLIATVDQESAEASDSLPRDLCESWRKVLAAALTEPYLIVEARESPMVIPVGETRRVRFGTTIDGAPTAASSAEQVVSATVDAGQGLVTLRAVAAGSVVVALRVGRLEHPMAVEARRWAARLAAAARGRVFGDAWGTAMARAAAANASLMAIRPEPGAAVRVAAVEEAEGYYRVQISARGPEYLPVSRTLPVALSSGGPPIPAPQALLVSNYPESVASPRTLLRERLAGGVPVRLMWHHVNAWEGPVNITVRLVNPRQQQARVRVSWADSGPGSDEIFVGYTAMQRFWEVLGRSCGFEAQVPAGRAYEPSRIRAVPGRVVSGVMHLCAEEGSEVFLEVAAAEVGGEDDYFRPVAREGWEQAELTPYRFVASREMQMEYVVGEGWAHAYLGREEIVNEQGEALRGAYGVMHLIRMDVRNPGGEQARVQVAVRAGGGPARVVASVDGRLSETGLLAAGQEQVLAERPVEAGARRTLRMLMMPAAGSNLPLTVILRVRPRG